MKDLCSATFRCSEDLLTVGWKLGHVDVSAMPFEAPQANCTCGVENPHRTIIISSEDLSAIPCYPTWPRKAMRRCPPAVSPWESSGENTAWYTALAWPVNFCWHSPEATSKMLSVICKSCDHLLSSKGEVGLVDVCAVFLEDLQTRHSDSTRAPWHRAMRLAPDHPSVRSTRYVGPAHIWPQNFWRASLSELQSLAVRSDDAVNTCPTGPKLAETTGPLWESTLSQEPVCKSHNLALRSPLPELHR